MYRGQNRRFFNVHTIIGAETVCEVQDSAGLVLYVCRKQLHFKSRTGSFAKWTKQKDESFVPTLKTSAFLRILLSHFASYFHNGSAFQFVVNPIARTSAMGYLVSKALTSEVKWLFASILLSQYAMQHS